MLDTRMRLPHRATATMKRGGSTLSDLKQSRDLSEGSSCHADCRRGQHLIDKATKPGLQRLRIVSFGSEY